MQAIRNFIIYCTLVAEVLLLAACGSSSPELKPLSSQDVIVAFGDSLTYGTGASLQTSYPAVLEKITGIKVINEGVPGEETGAGLARINTVIKKHHPALVILCLGGNDLLRKRKPEQIKQNLRGIIQIIRNSGAAVLLIAAPEPSLTLSVPDFYAELGEEFNIPVDEVTLRSLLRQRDLKSDYIQLNAAGYHAFAESIADTLRKTGARK